MSVTIPCRPDLTHYDMQVVLDEISYTLEFRWNTREQAWYMSLGTEAGDPIRSSIKIVVGFPIGGRLLNGPPGRFLAFDTTNFDRNPGIKDLGDRVMFIYFTQDEFV